MRQHVPPQQLWNEFHGDLEFEYDHDIYWPTLLKMCEQNQVEKHERWVTAGKNYGESEVYLKGGDKPQQSGVTESTPAEVSVKQTEQAAPIQTNGTQANGNSDILAVSSVSATEEAKA